MDDHVYKKQNHLKSLQGVVKKFCILKGYHTGYDYTTFRKSIYTWWALFMTDLVPTSKNRA